MLQDLRFETSKRRKSCQPPITKFFGWNKNLQSNFLLAVWISGPKAKTENECELHCLERKCT